MRALVSLIAAAALLAACGSKGPLYLPKPEGQKPAAAQPAGEPEQKKPEREP